MTTELSEPFLSGPTKPVAAVPVGMPAVVGEQALARTWTSELCDCFSDMTSCCATCFCLPTVLAQLWARTMPGAKGTCVILATFLWIAAVAGTLASSHPSGTVTPKHPHGAVGRNPLTNVLSLLGLAGSLASCVIVMSLRHYVRRRDGIPAGDCQCCCGNDCCLATFCATCSTCQLMRHEGLTAGRYKLCSPLGETAV